MHAYQAEDLGMVFMLALIMELALSYQQENQ
jgi:hypothetical protein